mmetsp:Transcript_27150/g.62612  ORF Transcript_27150/g.62612 Transcript_27150/m.62612 type:complete len:254 (+) Transcript_27150:742-1503(+)
MVCRFPRTAPPVHWQWPRSLLNRRLPKSKRMRKWQALTAPVRILTVRRPSFKFHKFWLRRRPSSHHRLRTGMLKRRHNLLQFSSRSNRSCNTPKCSRSSSSSKLLSRRLQGSSSRRCKSCSSRPNSSRPNSSYPISSSRNSSRPFRYWLQHCHRGYKACHRSCWRTRPHLSSCNKPLLPRSIRISRVARTVAFLVSPRLHQAICSLQMAWQLSFGSQCGTVSHSKGPRGPVHLAARCRSMAQWWLQITRTTLE